MPDVEGESFSNNWASGDSSVQLVREFDFSVVLEKDKDINNISFYNSCNVDEAVKKKVKVSPGSQKDRYHGNAGTKEGLSPIGRFRS